MSFLFYAVIVDFSLEFVDFIHRIYQSEEEIKILGELVMNKIFFSLAIVQVLMGMLFPLGILSAIKIFRRFRESEELRKLLYFVSLILIQGGIFATRWNVVIGGQMFSKSFRGLTPYKMEVGGVAGVLSRLRSRSSARSLPVPLDASSSSLHRPPRRPPRITSGPRVAGGAAEGRGGRAALSGGKVTRKVAGFT